MPTKTQTTLRLELANGSRVIALPAGEEKIRGFSGVNLLIIDEAARVPDELYYSIRPMLAVSGGRLAALSTPWGRKGWFYHEWARSEHWRKVKITARECPRLTAEILEQERESLGEWWFRQEYGCEFAEPGTEDSLIAPDWVEAAQYDPAEPPQSVGPIDIGLDVARSLRGDRTAFALAQGDTIITLEAGHQPDTMATVGRAVRLIEETKARSIRVDDTGVGGGVTDRLYEVQGAYSASKELRYCEILGFNFGSKPFDTDRFANLRTEMWWSLSERLRRGELRFPVNPALVEQLAAPTLLQDSSGRLRLESKDSMKRRGLGSPDLGDALVLACYPDEWVHLLHSSCLRPHPSHLRVPSGRTLPSPFSARF